MEESNARRWGALPMTIHKSGPPDEIFKQIPVFSLADPRKFCLGGNPHMDLVMREPAPGSSNPPIPVGLVSKTYNLIQHQALLREAVQFVAQTGGSPVDNVQISMTPNCERLFFKINFGEKFKISPDGKDVTLQLLCKNAVDGTSAVRASLGWFRLICSNGLTVGVTLKKVWKAHKADFDLLSVFDPLKEQMQAIQAEKNELHRWTKLKIDSAPLCRWVDSTVAQRWGPLAASRVWHICSSGRDAAFAPPFRRAPASARRVKLLDPVPGAKPGAGNIYAVVQALSWVASHRNDLMEADIMTREIPQMINPLIHSAS